MNIKQLRYFCRIYELKNMTHAAEALYIAQSALSQQMQTLEKTLGVQLFLRKAQGVTPTPEAALLYQHSQTILRQLDATRSLLGRDSDEFISGRVSLGMASSTARMLALPLIQEVHRKLPAVVLEIVDVPSADLTKSVIQGRLDFSLSPDQQATRGIEVRPLLIEELFLLAHPDTPIHANPVTIEAIKDLPIILPSQPNQLRARIDHAFLSARLSYSLLAEASTAATLIPALEAAMAITILPYSAASSEIDAGKISAYPFATALYREISLCWSTYNPPTPAVKRVMQIAIEILQTLVETKTWKHVTIPEGDKELN
ncbi:LysR substrate-binding domain-containing protein [Alcaligenes endophyticus]|uniref:LysR family transcriptional regulator n=1 Tax=Alcaligenes endophyticus TaxID=1929088 RepID=A0ABT8ELA1_9BURK|nr:LysR substrate-binding domain-containing protein [Alcaligenes endophyticus]MCX5590646.1 LysR substrate-binding domain-containing protein [Alcaligenes endophyticus]MDN4121990.1 LysR family transcriptional regulator [Alcaligenes endophyticus]